MIPFVDLKAQYSSIKDEIDEAVLRVLGSGQYVLGKEVATFEERFAAYCSTQHAVAVNSGTSALHLALLAAGVGPGDEVVTVSHTFVATVAAIRYTGATPVFVDVDAQTFNMDPLDLDRKIKRVAAAGDLVPRAVIAVDLFGLPADYAKIGVIAKQHSLLMIADAAQSFGAEAGGQRWGA